MGKKDKEREKPRGGDVVSNLCDLTDKGKGKKRKEGEVKTQTARTKAVTKIE